MVRLLSLAFAVLASCSSLFGYQKAEITPGWPGEFHFCGTNTPVTARLSFKLPAGTAFRDRVIVRRSRFELPARILFKHEESGQVFIFRPGEIAWMDVAYNSFYFGWTGKGIGDDQEKAKAFAVHMGYKARQLTILRLKLKDGTLLQGDAPSDINYILLTDPGVKLYGDTFWEQLKDLKEAKRWNVKSVVNWVNTWPVFPWAEKLLKICELKLEGKYSETTVTVADLVRIEIVSAR